MTTREKAYPTQIPDLDREILLRTDLAVLNAVRQTNRYSTTICTPTFWRARFAREYVDLGLSESSFNYMKAVYGASTLGSVDLLDYSIRIRSRLFVDYLLRTRTYTVKQLARALNTACEWSTIDVVACLLHRSGTDVDRYNDFYLFVAFRSSNYEVIRYLLKNGILPSERWLEKVALYGDLTILDLLHELNSNRLRENHDTVLRYSALKGRYEFVKRLLAYCPNLDYDQPTVVESAIHGAHTDLLRLIDHGFDYRHHRSLLTKAATTGSLEMVRYLQSKAPASLDQLRDAFIEVYQTGKTDLIDYLYEQGVVVSEIDNLFVSALNNNLEPEKLTDLLEKGMKISQEDLNRSIDECLSQEQYDIVTWLLDHGAIPMPDDPTLRQAVYSYDTQLVGRLIDLGATDLDEALDEAVHDNNLTMVKYLTERGATIDKHIAELSEVTLYLASIAQERRKKI